MKMTVLAQRFLAAVMFLIGIESSHAQATGPGSALTFNGTNQYGLFTRSISNDFTIEFWFASTKVYDITNNWYNGLGLVDAEVGGVAADFGVSLGGGKVLFGIGSPDTTIAATNFVTDGAWHHVAATRVKTSGAMALYIDGVLAGSRSGSTTTRTAPANISIGALLTGINYLQGSMDEVRIWTVARTAAQISQNMNRSLVGNETGLRNYFRFDEGTNSTAFDTTANASNASLSNAPTWIMSTAPIGVPQISTPVTSGLTASSGTVSCNITPNNQATAVYLTYGTNTSYGSFSTTNLIAADSGTTPFSVMLPNLLMGTQYYGQIVATNSAGTNTSAFTFSTPGAPALVSVSASSITATSATLNATVNPNGGLTTLRLYYGLIPSNSVVLTNIAAGSTNVTFSTNLTDLVPGTVYHLSAVVTNDLGTNSSGDVSFATSTAVPSTTATTIGGASGSRLNLTNTISPNGASSTAWFEYGLTTNYNQTTTATNVGPYNTALSFDGSSRYVNAGSGINLSNSSFTVEGWAKYMGAGGYQMILGQGTSPGNNSYLHFGFRDNGNFTFAFFGNDLDVTNAADSKWHHWAGTYDATNRARKIYCDGTLVASDTAVTNFLGAGPFYIGQANGHMFQGSIAEVRVWNVPLTQAAIQGAMIGRLTPSHPSYANLQAYWPLCEGSGTVAFDCSGTGNNGTLINSPTWNTGFALRDQAVGLLPTATYHFRVVASNSIGVAYGGDVVFTTAAATIYNVTTLTDGGPGSLRQAITDASAAFNSAVINLTNLSGTITLTNWLPIIFQDMTINGPGVTNLTISGSNAFRVFFVDASNATVSINRLTIANGRAKGGDGVYRGGGGAGLGGALFVNAGNVTISSVAMTGNSAFGGSGGSSGNLPSGGGGGGLGGNGGTCGGFSGGGGGGFGGNGGAGAGGGGYNGGAGGGGGIVGRGGNGYLQGGGGGGGGWSNGGDAVGQSGAPGALEGGTGGSTTGTLSGGTGLLYGGGGGGGNDSYDGSNGGKGGKYGGGGGAIWSDSRGGAGGDFGGGGGTGGNESTAFGGNGGFGGGGGGGGGASITGSSASAGSGGFGGGGGGAIYPNTRGSGGAFGGAGGYDVTSRAAWGGGGGGGAALGGAIFVRGNNGANLTFVDSVCSGGTVVGGIGGAGYFGTTPPPSFDGSPGLTSGNGLFLLGGTNTLMVNNGSTQTLSDSIGGWSGAAAHVRKNGTGKLTLASTNSYTGLTLVDAGTLLINGDNSASSNHVINSGGTIGGTGLVSRVTVNPGGTISPGLDVGVFNSGNVVWSGAGNYNWQIWNATNSAGVGSDLLFIAGTLDVSAANGFNINTWSLSGLATNGNAIGFDSRAFRSWKIVQTTGGIVGFAATNFNIVTNASNGTAGFSNPLLNGSFSLEVVGLDLVLKFTPVIPAVTTLAASNVVDTSALLNGVVNPNGSMTTYYFDYGATTNYGNFSAANTLVPGTNFVNISTTVSNLAVVTNYHFRVVAYNSFGTTYGADMTFTTLAGAPAVVTQSATAITSGGATLNSSITPNGNSTTSYFQYGLTTAYGSVTSTGSIGSGTSPVSFSNTVSGLSIGTVYHYRAVAMNGVGTNYGADLTFKTLATAPTSTTAAATNIASFAATLTGTANPKGDEAVAYFELGTNASYGITTPQSSLGNGITNMVVNYGVTNLLPGTLYHYRLVASNSLGKTFGGDLTFTTTVALPAIQLQSASGITSSNATLNASINPNGGATAAYFEYGTNASYGSFSVTNSIGNGTQAAPLSVAINDLSPGRTYYYRVVATNSVGSAVGTNATFATLAAAPGVTTLSATSISATNAILNGLVNPNAASTEVYFVCGTNAVYSNKTVSVNVGSGFSAIPANVPITGLVPNTLYYFRCEASNNVGTNSGQELTFTTAAALPIAVTLSPQNLTATNAQLGASINANGAVTAVYFEYGFSTDYGRRTVTNFTDASPTAQIVTINAENVFPQHAYHCRVVASNSVGIAIGNDVAFNSYTAAPDVQTLPASAVSIHAAKLNGALKPNGDAAVRFQYGATTNYDFVTETNNYSLPMAAMNFDGNTGYGSVPGGTWFSGDFTVEAWVYLRSYNNWSRLFDFGNGPANENVLLALSEGTSGRVHFGVWKNGVEQSITSPSSLPTNQWIHIAASLAGNTATVYTNGIAWMSGTVAPPNSVTRLNNYFGRSNWGADADANMAMYEVRIWNSALDASTIRGWMNGSLQPAHPRYANLIGYWQMNEGSGAISADASGHNKIMTLNAGYNWLDLPSDNSFALNAVVTNLTGATTYHFRAVASNSTGVAYGNDLLFTTVPPVAPTIVSQSVTNITQLSATLNASINPNEGMTVAYFQYGFDTNYGFLCNTTNLGSGTNAISIAATLTNLVPGSVYHFRSVATNDVGTTVGADQTFSTLVLAAPAVTTLPAIVNLGTNAILNGSVNPSGAPTMVYFEYGVDTNYGTLMLVTNISGDANIQVSQAVALVLGDYHYRIVASNSVGKVAGNDVAFSVTRLEVYWYGYSGQSWSTGDWYINGALGVPIPPPNDATVFAHISDDNEGAGTGGFVDQPWSFYGLTWDEGFGANLKLTGAQLSVGAGGLNLTVGYPAEVDNDIQLAAPQTWTLLDNIKILGRISGSSSLTLNSTYRDGTTLQLAPTNTFSGGLILDNFTLALPNETAIGTGSLTLRNGKLDLGGDRAITNTLIVDGSAAIASGNLTVNGIISVPANGSIDTDASGGVIVNGAVSGLGRLTKIGAGSLSLLTSNNFVGGITLSNGTLNLGHYQVMGPGVLVLKGGTLQAPTALAITNTVSLEGPVTVGGNTIALNGAVAITNPATLTVSSSLTVNGAFFGGNSLTKNGSGVLLLNGNSASTGSVTVSGGTLLANNITGSATGSGGVTVNSTATVGGDGTISGNTTFNSGSICSPGNGVGMLTLGSTIFSRGANYHWQLRDAQGAAGVGYDVLKVNGALTLPGGSFTINLNLSTLNAANTPGNAINFNKFVAQSWVLAQTTGGVINFTPTRIKISTTPLSGSSGFANPYDAGGVFSVSLVGNNLVLNFIPSVPPGIGSGVVNGDGTFQMHLTGTVGKSYTLQTSVDLSAWVDYTNFLMGTNGALDYFDISATNDSRRFYRLKNP